MMKPFEKKFIRYLVSVNDAIWVTYRFMKRYDRKDYHARCITELSIVIAQLCVTLKKRKGGKKKKKEKRKKESRCRIFTERSV